MKKTFILLALLAAPLFGGAQTIRESGGWFESGYITFSLSDDAASYHVYCKPVGGEYRKLDDALVRNYGTYGRADAVGIAAGEYVFKVVPVDAEGSEMERLAAESSAVEVRAYDRSGFAFTGGMSPGAYNSDGTLKPNTVVLYVTDKNKDAVKLDVVTSSKGATTVCTGIQNILTGFKKGYDSRCLAIRLIGQVGVPSVSSKGDLEIDMGGKTVCPGITLEGIGCDATADGWGIRIKNATSVEIRNIGVINCSSSEGDNIGLQQENKYIWVHNNDLFYGNAGSDADQAKGDGALDCKRSTLVTLSYNHFWDCGKCNLLGLKDENDQMYVCYHHNWFDHSDSRHPRIRSFSCHVYNNYFDGCAKYGVGACMASSVFVENNYFRNTSRPMMISMQGTDIASGEGTFSSEDGGMIKAYGNVFAERSSSFRFVSWQDNHVEFDAYVAASRDEKVPAEVKTKKGGTGYNNFDTDAAIMFDYTPDAAEDVPTILAGAYGAGRMQHGDLQWTFNNAVDDADYSVNKALKAAVTGYRTSLVGLFTDDGEVSGGGDEGSGEGEEGGGEVNPPAIPTGGYECYFTDRKPSNPFYTISGNCSNSHGSATINGVTHTDCLKMETKTSIKFTIAEEMTLTLVFADGSVPNIKIDGEKVSASGSSIITRTLLAGAHELTKADSHYLFYINLTGGSSAVKILTADDEGDAPLYDLQGRRVVRPQSGNVYIRNGKKFLKR